MECEKGHSSLFPDFSDIFIRDEVFGKPIHNKKGIVQLLSPLAISYPGLLILSLKM